ncbi:MAG: SRPBCC family protein [Candidatus Promineifilaceae bacterium]|nr:SRPBCC family protein [Candidatus Promineifilaceae bacterium]
MAKQVTKSIIIKSDLESIFNLWADFENFPHFMRHVKAVKKLDDRLSEWTVAGPLGASVRWKAELTRFEENKRIGWNTKDHEGMLTTSGQVSFNPLPEGEVQVTVVLQYTPPAGVAGEVVAHLLIDPEERLETDLRNFKQFAEGMYDRTAQ